MVWSGGTYKKGNFTTNGWTGDASLGIGIEAGRHDTQDDDFATGINQCLNKDGSNAATGNLNAGAFRVTNIGAGTARTDAAQVGQVQDGDFIWLGTTAGTATAQTASATPAITAYKTGQKFRALIGAGLSSTGQSPTGHTININGLGAKSIVNNETAASSPTAGSWVAGAFIELIYDGTNFRIINNPSGWQDYTVTTANFTGVAPNVVTSVSTVEVSRYIKIGKKVTWEIGLQFNLGTGGGTLLNLVPPVFGGAAIAATNCFFTGGYFADSAAGSVGVFYFSSAGNLRCGRNMLTAATWAAFGLCYLRGVFTYESA
jgi:hypothetical protein